MATDTLEIFGTEYTGVTGIKATDDQSGTKVYIRPQGTKSITQNGSGIDVAEYASVDVNVPSGQPNLQSKTHTVSSAGTATVTADSGYDGLSSVAVSVPSADPWVETCDASFYTEGGRRYWKIDPRVVVNVGEGDAEGWVPDSYSKKGESYECSAVPANTVITPNSTTQTVGGANYMMEGAVTVEAIPSGSSKNTQVVQGTTRTNASALTAIGSELTVSKTGTYDIYYSCFRTNTSASYTWATRLYINGTAYGTAESTTWTNNQQNTHLSNISLTTGDKLRVYGRNTRGTSYYICAPMLAIVEA